MVRVKERYLLVNFIYPRDPGDKSNVPDFVAFHRPTQPELTPQLLVRAIKAEVYALFGDCGAGAVERTLSVKFLSKTTSTAILRVTREHLRYVWTALTFMRQTPVRNGRPCIFRVARVSGTMRKVQEEAIRQSRALMLATKAHVSGQTQSAFDMLTRATKESVSGALLAGVDMDDGDDGNDIADEDSHASDSGHDLDLHDGDSDSGRG